MGTFIIVSNVMIVLSHTNYESSVAVMVGFVLREGGGGGGGLRGIVLVPWGTTGGATRDSASVYNSSSEDEGDDMDASESKGFPVLFRRRL